MWSWWSYINGGDGCPGGVRVASGPLSLEARGLSASDCVPARWAGETIGSHAQSNEPSAEALRQRLRRIKTVFFAEAAKRGKLEHRIVVQRDTGESISLAGQHHGLRFLVP